MAAGVLLFPGYLGQSGSRCALLDGWDSVVHKSRTGLLSLGVPGVPWHTQILADQLTLFQPGRTDYAHLITTGTPEFSDLLTAL